MKKEIMRVIKGIGIAVVGIPLLLIALFIVCEVFGAVVNHAATGKQTKEIRNMISEEIDDAQIIDVQSETGNSSGTGNHVDCLTRISFTSGKDEETIAGILDKGYEFFDLRSENDIYTVTIITGAPFRDNIEGH